MYFSQGCWAGVVQSTHYNPHCRTESGGGRHPLVDWPRAKWGDRRQTTPEKSPQDAVGLTGDSRHFHQFKKLK